MRKLALLLGLLSFACSKGSPPPAPPPAAGLAKTTAITFASTPAGAQVVLDGKALPGATPLTAELPTGGGDRIARFALPGFEPQTVTFLVGLQPDTVKVQLAEAPRVQVQTEPPGAQVQLDGKVALAATPGEVALTSGEHELLVSLPFRVPAHRRLKPGEKGPLRFELPPAATVAVSSTPPGARIFVDDLDTFLVTPADVPVAAARAHRIEARLEKLRSRPARVKKLRVGAKAQVALVLADLGHADLLARRKQLQRQLAALQVEQKRYEKKTSHFVVHDTRQELADEQHLDEVGDRIEQLSGELADLDDQLEPQ